MSWLDAVGWSGSTLLVWSLMQTRVLRLRALNLLGSVVLTGFNAALRVWPMVGLNIVLGGINIYFLYRMLTTRTAERSYQIVPVAPGDAYLTHLLQAHAADIAVFNPDLRWDAGDIRQAFLIILGDEAVGIVAFRDAGAGVAQVVLDYVTPKYRDLTPGRFVYLRSPLFTERGFQRVISPPGMVKPYYRSLGFRPEGNAWALDLA